jgi:hypothetical protein
MMIALSACGNPPKESSSDPLVTDVEQSAVKKQSIGNCWLYAAASWAESLHKSATGNEVDLSESYWTWWHFYNQIVGRNLSTLQTGGWWSTSNNIIYKHGYVLEGEFLADEEGQPLSSAQSQAESAINEALKEGGKLATIEQRTPENVRAVLDEAFGSDMAAAEALSRDASSFVVGADQGNGTVSLLDAIYGKPNHRWSYASYYQVYGEGNEANLWQSKSRKKLLQRVMRALNDRQPVVISLMIDFNAWDQESAEFNIATLEEAGGMGRQGGHMLVLEDYTVTDVPGVGEIGEGDVSDELKQKALQGKVKTLVTKNSWGTGANEGYHRFNRDYLDGTLSWKSGEEVQWYTTLSGFILPPGY